MRSNHLETLGDMLADAVEEAQRQKRRVRRHLAGLRGDWESAPVRGPWKAGMPGVKWHLYQASQRKHHQLTQRVRALAWALKQIKP